MENECVRSRCQAGVDVGVVIVEDLESYCQNWLVCWQKYNTTYVPIDVMPVSRLSAHTMKKQIPGPDRPTRILRSISPFTFPIFHNGGNRSSRCLRGTGEGRDEGMDSSSLLLKDQRSDAKIKDQMEI